MSVYDCNPKDAMVGDFDYSCCSVVDDGDDGVLHEKDCSIAINRYLDDCSVCEKRGGFIPFQHGIRVCVPCQDEYNDSIEELM